MTRQRKLLLLSLVLGLALLIVLVLRSRQGPMSSPPAAPQRTSAWVVAEPPADPSQALPHTAAAPAHRNASPLVVRVQDIMQGPIAGAEVSIAAVVVGVTDGAGELHVDLRALTLPAAGELFVRADGYAAGSGHYASPCVVSVKLVPEARVAGVVLAQGTGAALPGVVVALGPEAQVTSDGEGRFHFRNIAAGSYQLWGRGQAGTAPFPTL